MKNPLKIALNILDRTPQSTKGQSLVEMTMTLPILLVMLLGLVEVGWLANNYLTLLDVTREAGRAGSTQDPLTWLSGDTRNYSRMDCESDGGTFNKYLGQNPPAYSFPGDTVKLNARGYGTGAEAVLGFYDSVACNAVVSILPLEFKDLIDDVVISVVTYAIVEDTGPSDLHAVITGRFPSNANECADDGRDPFAPAYLPAIQRDPFGYDTTIDERQRGYVFRGNHMEDGDCMGSQFNLSEIEDLLNRTTIFDDNSDITDDEIQYVPNNAIVIVEIYWEHEQLLGLPFFTWIADPIEIGVWSFFPVSAAEPTATP